MSEVQALAIFCDDVRQEIGNKLSIIGVYGTDIRFKAKPPVLYPKLCVVVWVWADVEALPDTLRIQALGQPGKIPLFAADLAKPADERMKGNNKARIQAAFEISPLEIKQQGRIDIEVQYGEMAIRAGQINLQFEGAEESS